eukprot:TRINITY_DN23185_c0_g1_i1.p1 TRINITY_DN23185_c0_g1~~TRINITY_DN23185_c0_g1_i1.p1  ORF type:complete len:228 (+),score=38.00 TRINITY_DN23185_c0_g1_i1:166-849(+)
MASIFSSSFPPLLLRRSRNPNSLHFIIPSSIIHLPLVRTHSLSPRFRALKTGADGGCVGSQDAKDPALLRKPSISSSDLELEGKEKKDFEEIDDESSVSREGSGEVDWEDQILEDTVPLVGFVRMIIHSGTYESGDRLSPEHEKVILERLLPYHPQFEKKIGCGVHFITIGYHPDFESSRCMFIVRKDGELVDFSYWKCIKGLIRKKYPLYADSFILRHFRRRRHSD